MKPKFKLQTKKGQIVYKIEVNIRTEETMKNNSGMNKHGIFVEELKIVHQTKYKTVLSDPWVSMFDRQLEDQRKDSYNRYIEDIFVSIKTKETYWANGIFATMYSLEDPQKCISKIKKKITDQINKDYGFLRFVDIESVIESMQISTLK
ncbi:MAG: hypothetical protein LLF95_12270 [Bacteroidales bacterium]|nr:hypothetical protein [Bacteroidales bacterium]